jgi:hypothetical protein
VVVVEALVAVGLVGKVVEFVQFAGQLISERITIHSVYVGQDRSSVFLPNVHSDYTFSVFPLHTITNKNSQTKITSHLV